VPSSVRAHWPGQEKAPQVLRDAGLLPALLAVGLEHCRRGRPQRRSATSPCCTSTEAWTYHPARHPSEWFLVRHTFPRERVPV